VLDTLARSIPGADENSARDLGFFIANADAIARELEVVVIVVHHAGKSVERGMRGSSALHGAADAEWEVSAGDAGRLVKVVKMKDGADDLAVGFGRGRRPGDDLHRRHFRRPETGGNIGGQA